MFQKGKSLFSKNGDNFIRLLCLVVLIGSFLLSFGTSPTTPDDVVKEKKKGSDKNIRENIQIAFPPMPKILFAIYFAFA